MEPITESPGVYFNPIGTVRTSNDFLHILVPVDISYIHPHILNIQNALESTKDLCLQKDIVKDTECFNILQPLFSRFDDLTKDYNAISHLISLRDKRSAWFAGIGSVFKQIIGTMDENDAINYNNAIQTLNNKNIQLASLFKENILLTKTALSRYNETLNIVQINAIRLNSAIEALYDNFNNLTSVTNSLSIRSKFNEIYNELASSLLTLSFKMDDIINSIMLTKSHSLHPSVLTPRQLFKELSDNIISLPKNKELALSLSLDNIYALVDMSTLMCYATTNKIVFVIKIPLVSSIEYNLYKTIPMPVPHNPKNPNSYAMIIPTCNFIAISKDKSSYVCLDHLRDCVQTVNTIYICDNTNVHSIEYVPICEIEILLKILTVLPNSCNTKFIHGQVDIWQILNENKWIYVQSEPTKLSIECQSNSMEFKLLGSGILNLQPKCTAYCKNREFIASSNLEINVKPITSDFNLINDTCCSISKFHKLKPKLLPLKLSEINLEKLPNIITDKFVNNLDDIINNQVQPVYTSHVSILTYCLTTLICLLVIYKICKRFVKWPRLRNQNNNNNDEVDSGIEDIPMPRLRINT